MHVVKLNKEILYNPEDATFRSAPEPKSIILTLDNLETCIFNDLVNANGELVSYEALFGHWQDKIVTDGVLSRVISSLRGKLKKLGITEVKVTNVSKKGYKLDGELEWRNYAGSFATDVKTVKTISVFHAGLIVAGLISLITVLFLLLFTSYESNKTDLSFQQFNNVLSNEEDKYSLAVSPSNNRITYITKNEENLWSQTVFDMVSSVGINVIDGNNHVLGGQFISDDTLIIYSLSDIECTIKLVNLNFVELNYALTNFMSCNRSGVGMHIAPWTDNEILYLESVSSTLSANVYKANLDTGESSLIDIDNQDLGMIYGVYAEKHCQQLALLSSFEEKDNRVSLVDLNQGGKEVWFENVPETLHSVAWDCDRLVYKSTTGTLTVHQFKGGRLSQTEKIPVLGNYYNPIKISDGIALIKGIEHTASITLEDNQGYKNITRPSSAKQKLPLYWDDANILYWSNEKGRWQLNRYDIDHNKVGIVAELEGVADFENFAVNGEQNLIAIQLESHIQIFKLDETLTSMTRIEQFEGINPYFFKGKIVYAKKGENITNLYMREVKSEVERMIVAGGHSAIVRDGELYFDYWSKLGLWKYNESGAHQLHYEFSFEFLRFVESDNNFIVVSLTGDYYELTPEGPIKLNYSKLNRLSEVRNGTSLGVANAPETTSVFFAKWR